jgi:hypothetical protein
MKHQNHRHPKTSSLSEQQRAIVVEAICTLIDSLLDLLIAIDPAPPYDASFIGWEFPAYSRPHRRRARLEDDNSDLTWCASFTRNKLDLIQGASMQPPSPSSHSERSEPSEPGVHYSWAYPLQAVWDKKIRTSRN